MSGIRILIKVDIEVGSWVGVGNNVSLVGAQRSSWSVDWEGWLGGADLVSLVLGHTLD